MLFSKIYLSIIIIYGKIFNKFALYGGKNAMEQIYINFSEKFGIKYKDLPLIIDNINKHIYINIKVNQVFYSETFESFRLTV